MESKDPPQLVKVEILNIRRWIFSKAPTEISNGYVIIKSPQVIHGGDM